MASKQIMPAEKEPSLGELAQLVDRTEKLRRNSHALQQWARELQEAAKTACSGAASLYDRTEAARKRALRQRRRSQRRSKSTVRTTNRAH